MEVEEDVVEDGVVEAQAQEEEEVNDICGEREARRREVGFWGRGYYAQARPGAGVMTLQLLLLPVLLSVVVGRMVDVRAMRQGRTCKSQGRL